MPATLFDTFRSVNAVIDSARSEAERAAGLFTGPPDPNRDEVVRLYNRLLKVIEVLDTASGTPGMSAYVQVEWGASAPEFITKALAIRNASQDVVNYVAENYPTMGRVLDQAMTALNVPVGQQNALRAELGGNLDFLLVEKATAVGVAPVSIPAGQLTALVSLLNILVIAATI